MIPTAFTIFPLKILQKVTNFVIIRFNLVLEMKIFRDMSYKEIARELNLSEVTVHTHVKRAYKAIREALPVVYFLWSVLGKI